MRRYAKASTAGSTQRQASRLGRFFRGAFATRRAPVDFEGSGASSTGSLALRKALPLSALPLTLAALVLPASASAAVPSIPTTTVSAVTTKAAVLEADINPQGEATTYHFEYGPADCAANPCASAPVPNGNVGAGSAAVRVQKEVEGLTPGTTYHFRAVATNGSGTVNGPDRTFTTYESPPAVSCPNQAFRVGAAANLPDCRAYEMVSPVEKGGQGILQGAGFFFSNLAGYDQSALDGDKITYTSATSFGDQISSINANQYFASRGADGWRTHGINPPTGRTLGEPAISFTGVFETPFKLFNDDLSTAWMSDYDVNTLTPDAAQGFPNLYRRDNLAEAYEPLSTNAFKNPAEYPYYVLSEEFLEVQGHSSDFSHVVFSEAVPLTPDAATGMNRQLYDFSGGQLHLVSVLPNGTASPNASHAGTVQLTKEHEAWFLHAVSDDGSRIFWSSNKLYVRENPDQPQSALNGAEECTEAAKACTLPISNSNSEQFWTASADGSKAIFSEGGLSGHGATLYEFDVDTETQTPIAGQVSGVLGASDDASYLYFTSWENLAAGATAGQPNLYLDHEGTIAFVAPLSPEDTTTKSAGLVTDATVDSNMSKFHASRVTPNGLHLAFESVHPQLGYDNTDAANGKADVEVYLYDAAAGELACVSCNPSGARSVGQALEIPDAFVHEPSSLWAAAWLPTWSHNLYAPRALSDDGKRLYFNSFDALLPRDTNGAQDVYQWEAQGTGGCQKAGGCISLISTGQDAKKSQFIDATPDGSDVFIRTDSSIAPQDPGLADIYDARVEGGYPPPPAPPTPCVGDACQSIPPAPNDPTPASAAFRGAGDPQPRKRRSCRAHRHAAAKGAKRKQAKAKAKQQAKRCRHAKRGAGR